jgi:hypothetical protein
MVLDKPAQRIFIEGIADFYVGLDQPQKALVAGMLWIVLAAAFTNLASAVIFKKERQNQEDPFQIVLSQPVGGGNKRWSKARIKMQKGRGGINSSRPKPGVFIHEAHAGSHSSPKSIWGSSASHRKKSEGLLKSQDIEKPSRILNPRYWNVSRIMASAQVLIRGELGKRLRKSRGTVSLRYVRFFWKIDAIFREAQARARKTGEMLAARTQTTAFVIDEHENNVGYPLASQDPRFPSQAVAEMDFILSANENDLIALKLVFGYVWVARRQHRMLSDSPRERHVGYSGLFLPTDASDEEIAYDSIAIAKETGAIVLSNSDNLRRICVESGIRCMDIVMWRLTMPHRC